MLKMKKKMKLNKADKDVAADNNNNKYKVKSTVQNDLKHSVK